MAMKTLTPFGVEVKKKLLDLNKTQAEFCEENHIPLNRFSELLNGIAPNRKYRETVIKALDIRVSA